MENFLEFLEKSLSAKDEDIITYFVSKDRLATSSEKLSNVLKKIQKEMSKTRADKSPSEIWIEETNGIGGFPYNQKMAEFYAMYYESILQDIFKAKLPPKLHNVLNEIFRFDWVLDGSSKFHHHSSSLRNTLDARKEKIEKLQELRKTWNL